MPSLTLQREFFATGQTHPLAFRLTALRRLQAGLQTFEANIIQALHDDLGKPSFEAYCSDLLPVRQELRHAIAQLAGWARPRRVATRWHHWPARAAVTLEPRGAVLILSPWNYPVQLSLAPLVSAVAAGNCITLKPSELAPATAAVMARLIEACFDPAHVTVLQGGPDTATRLTALPWNHIFFTGSTPVGRAVATAAAANLVSTTLELGGCNPCIVDASANALTTARRIVWAKFLNAGQTCIAPNHVLVHVSRHGALIAALKQVLIQFYGNDGAGIQRIANPSHFARLTPLLAQGRAVHGGQSDAAALRIQPTLLVDLPAISPLLHEEIFGPILPVIPWQDEAELLQILAAAPPPLAVYLHTAKADLITLIQQHTQSGSLVVNDHIVQLTVPDLPFGGLGLSGSGRSHGRAGFETFSNIRSLYRQSPRIDLPMRYPPYEGKLAWVKRLMG